MTAGLLKAAGEASLSAAVMILAVLALRIKFQDRTPRGVFCLLWDLVLVRLLVLGALPSPVSILRLLPEVRTQSAIVPEPAVVTAVAEGGVVLQETWTWYAAEDAVLSAGTAHALPTLDVGAALTVLWLAAAALLAAGFLWSHLRSRRIYAASLPVRDSFIADWLALHPLRRPVQVRVSDRIDAPLTYGVLYPVILLPKSMAETCEDRHCAGSASTANPTTGPAVSQSDTACVLAHEHAHIRRFDALRKAFLAAALCVHWFNPLVWGMYVLAGRDIELACDEAVLRGGADREQYALALLGMEEQRGRWSPSGSHFSRSALEERIRAIMGRKWISVRAVAAVLVLMALATTVFACAAPEKKPEENVAGLVTVSRDDVEPYRSLVTYMESQEDGAVLMSKDAAVDQESEETLFGQYAEFGLVYKPRKGVTGALRYDDQPVCFFADVLPGGGTFRYADPSAKGGVELYCVYGEDGTLAGLMAMPDSSEGPYHPSREEIQAAREKALSGMSEEEIKRLNRTIIAANYGFEHAYLYDNVFGKLEDPDSPTWQFFETTGEIHIGNAVYTNNNTAYDFADLIADIRETVHDEGLRTDLQFIIDQARQAADDHSMACANELYKMLHDMDYFLLRYGPTIDEGRPDEWIQDKSTVEKFYGMLSCYS